MIRGLDSEHPREEQYDQLVQSYANAKRDFIASHHEPAPEFILKHFGDPTGKVLLDAGCGTGDEAAKYEQMGFAAVYGVEPAKQMLDEAFKKVAHPRNFRRGSYERTGFSDGSVDIVVGQYSLHYVEDLDAAYEELARILRPGGLLVMVVRHPSWDAAEPDHFQKHGRDYVRTIVYNQVPVENPVHTMDEYFSPRFKANFELIEIQEGTKPDATDKEVVPFFMGFAARRKVS